MSSIRLAIAIVAVLASAVLAQIRIGTVRGTVVDMRGAVIPSAAVRLVNASSGEAIEGVTDRAGRFEFNNVVFNRYLLKVEAAGFNPHSSAIVVNSNLPLEIPIGLNVAGAMESVEVSPHETLVDPTQSGSSTTLSSGFIRNSPRLNRSRQLQELIATTPGMATENNGLLHVRGVDDGILYVLDGIPIADRLDNFSGSSFDTDTIDSLQVITGNIPAEFGGRNAGVVIVQPRSGIDDRLSAAVRAGAGDFRTGDLAASFGGRFNRGFGIFLNGATNRSERFLDPVDRGNFNNHGGALNVNLRADWHPGERDTVLFNGSANGTDFRVPNDLVQQLNGQRQRQQLRDESFSISWQRLVSPDTVINAAALYRRHESRVFGSDRDIPIFADQDRVHTRAGLIASLTHQRRGHIVKGGLEAGRIAPREYFKFYITDEVVAGQRDVSEKALAFDEDDPFVFRDRRVRGNVSAYLQDQFSPARNLTVMAGLRFDYSSLLVADRQWSPRLGAVYFIPRTGTSLRASFNRLYQPPQVDNLLLSSSALARSLSPFAGDAGSGGADIRPEKVSAWEAGFAQDLGGIARLDAACWRRNFRNVGDPNVFFNTTVIFPNSVAAGFSRGLDVRLDVPERRGWAGWLSYTNMRILQTGPINGGLFLTSEFIEIGPGTRFIPDQDQRNTGAFGITWRHRRAGLLVGLSGRHESGVPLGLEEDDIDELRSAPGAELVDFERGRVRPRTIFNLSAGAELLKRDRVTISIQLDVLNLADKLFAYNFGNPFEGTHFGYGRRWSGGLRLEFR